MKLRSSPLLRAALFAPLLLNVDADGNPAGGCGPGPKPQPTAECAVADISSIAMSGLGQAELGFSSPVLQDAAGNTGVLIRKFGWGISFYFLPAGTQAWNVIDLSAGSNTAETGGGTASLMVSRFGHFVMAYEEKTPGTPVRYSLVALRYVPGVGMSAAVLVGGTLTPGTTPVTHSPHPFNVIDSDRVAVSIGYFSSGGNPSYRYSVVSFASGSSDYGTETGDTALTNRYETSPVLVETSSGLSTIYGMFRFGVGEMRASHRNGSAWEFQSGAFFTGANLASIDAKVLSTGKLEVVLFQQPSTITRFESPQTFPFSFSEPTVVADLSHDSISQRAMAWASTLKQDAAAADALLIYPSSESASELGFILPSTARTTGWNTSPMRSIVADWTNAVGSQYTASITKTQLGVNKCGRVAWFGFGNGHFAMHALQ